MSQKRKKGISELNDLRMLDPDVPGKEEQLLYQAYRQHFVGQDHGLRHLVRSIMLANTLKGQTRATDKPAAVFFAFGTTGSGKTLLAETTAKLFFNDPKAMTKIHCGEFQLKHEIAAMTGAPPGYVGYDDEPFLTQEKLDKWGFAASQKDLVMRRYLMLQAEIDRIFERLRQVGEIERTFNNSAFSYQAQIIGHYNEAVEQKKSLNERLARLITSRDKILNHRPELLQAKQEGYDPEKGYPSVVLIDEFEKADDSMRIALLGILDKGELTVKGKRGGRISFRNSIIFLTSNIAQEKMHEITGNRSMGYRNYNEKTAEEMKVHVEKMRKAVLSYGYEIIAKKFSPEFVGRIGEGNIFAFGPLSPSEYRECLDRITIPEFQKELSRQLGIAMEISFPVREFLVAESLAEKNIILGMRALKHVFNKQIRENIASLLSKQPEEGGIMPGDQIFVDLKDNGGSQRIVFLLSRTPEKTEQARQQLQAAMQQRIDLEGDLGLCTFDLLQGNLKEDCDN